MHNHGIMCARFDKKDYTVCRTRDSAISEWPRDAPYRWKFSRLLHNCIRYHL